MQRNSFCLELRIISAPGLHSRLRSYFLKSGMAQCHTPLSSADRISAPVLDCADGETGSHCADPWQPRQAIAMNTVELFQIACCNAQDIICISRH